MRKIVLALAIAAAASPAFAISRYNATSHTCDGVQQILQREGEAVFRYTSRTTGLGLYERLIGSGTRCGNGQMIQRMTIPTKDNPRCRVMVCRWGNDLRP